MFVIHRNTPFKFVPKFEIREIGEEIENDEEAVRAIEEETKTVEVNIKNMSEFIQKFHFDIMSHEEICEKLTEYGLDHFLDPSFPPTETSIYDKNSAPKYPFRVRPVWKRPTEFMKDPQLF